MMSPGLRPSDIIPIASGTSPHAPGLMTTTTTENLNNLLVYAIKNNNEPECDGDDSNEEPEILSEEIDEEQE